MRDPAPPATRPVENILEAQIALDRQGISPGSIDGEEGAQTEAALIAFQKKRGLAPGGLLDGQTKQLLLITQPIFTNYTVTSADLAGLSPVSQTWLAKSEQPRLDYENILELLGEKAFSNPRLIRALNPNLNWNQIAGGTQVRIPRVDYSMDMLISIPPKYSVAQVMGFMKGKTAIHIARVWAGGRKSFVGQQFWARGYWVSTVGRDEVAVRRYIQEQEKEDQCQDQLALMPL
jgi:hypothetical protein